MFRASLERDDFQRRVRLTHRVLDIAIAHGVDEGSKAGAADARSRGRFKNQTGFLRASIRPLSLSKSGETVWGGYESPAEYSIFLEKGTKAHWIRPQDRSGGASGRRSAFHTVGRNAGKKVKNPVFRAGGGKFLRFYIGGRVIFAREVWHPGTNPDPFMEPAKAAAEEATIARINLGIDQAQRIWE